MKGFQAAKLRNKFDRTCKGMLFAALVARKLREVSLLLHLYFIFFSNKKSETLLLIRLLTLLLFFLKNDAVRAKIIGRLS